MLAQTGTILTLETIRRKYRNDPVGFARDVLGVEFTDDQKEIARACPGRVKVNSGHGIGKSFLAACLVLWWMYTRENCAIVTTAPKKTQITGILWIEIRILWARANERQPGLLPDYFIGPQAPEMYDHPDHWAKGQVAEKGENFQGRHRPHMLFIFDESEGLAPIYWETTQTMYKPEMEHCWLSIGNPTTTASQSYIEDMAEDKDGNPKWKLFHLSALNHPNILAQLRGEPPPIENAVTLGQVEQWVKDWCTEIDAADFIPEEDLEWPPASGKFHRPGPLFKGRVLGKRPAEGVDTVWGMKAWKNTLVSRADPRRLWENSKGITIGVDVATYGDDESVFHVRSGPLSLHHESRNGWLEDKVADRIKELSTIWANWYNELATLDRELYKPKDVEVIVERDGPGSGVLSHNKGFGNWQGLVAAERAHDPEEYPDKRSEMWFNAEKLARQGAIDLTRVNTFAVSGSSPQKDTHNKLRKELLTPGYSVEVGRRRVESKKDYKKRLKRSPDNADGFLVSHYRMPNWAPQMVGSRT